MSTKTTHYHDIPIVIDGMTKILKSVTKYTTCNDVIKKLAKTGAPVSIFLSTDGKEKELAGKTKLLKIWRLQASSKESVLAVKQSEVRKTRRLSLNIFGGRKSDPKSSVSKDTVKQVSDLAFYIQKMKSKSSVNAMDAFPNKRDITLERRIAFTESLKTTKLGFKRKLLHKRSLVNKTSESTIRSTDTGYQSQTNDGEASNEVKAPLHRLPFGCYPGPQPRYSSTPVRPPFQHDFERKTTNDSFDVTCTSYEIPVLEEREGKSVLMRRFIMDTTLEEINLREGKHSGQGGQDYSSAPVFDSQEEKCRFYWDQNYDTDSDSSRSDEDTFSFVPDLDEAFVEQPGMLVSRGDTERRLKRESVLSNFSTFDICADQFDDIYFETESEDNVISFSFNGSFPESSDTEDFFLDYSCSSSESESDFSSSFEDNYYMRRKEENGVYSFLMTKELFTSEKTGYGSYDSEETKSVSDEGLGSMASDTYSEDQEFII